MQSPKSNSLRLTQLLIPCCAVMLSGCMYPGMYYGNPYRQPMYSPPQSINQGGMIGGPGSLYIPESSAPAYNPSTYDDEPGDPIDGFNKPDDANSPFFKSGETEGAPLPRGIGEDADELGVQFDPQPGFFEPESRTRPSAIQPVSATSAPVEYGFDTDNYTWLRGVLRYDESMRSWYITYSPAARDRFGGNLLLTASPAQLEGFRVGDMIDIHGHVDPAPTGSTDLPRYHAESIQRISM